MSHGMKPDAIATKMSGIAALACAPDRVAQRFS
jgi:hypothetical protein